MASTAGHLFLLKPMASSCCSASAFTVGSTCAWEVTLTGELPYRRSKPAKPVGAYHLGFCCRLGFAGRGCLAGKLIVLLFECGSCLFHLCLCVHGRCFVRLRSMQAVIKSLAATSTITGFIPTCHDASPCPQRSCGLSASCAAPSRWRSCTTSACRCATCEQGILDLCNTGPYIPAWLAALGAYKVEDLRQHTQAAEQKHTLHRQISSIKHVRLRWTPQSWSAQSLYCVLGPR